MQALKKQHSPLSFLTSSVFDTDAANFWLKKLNPLWSVNQSLGQIVHKEKAANGIFSLKIKCNRHFRMGQAGQHHPVFIEIDGRRYERSYSLHRIDEQHVLLTAKQVEQGVVSNWLAEHAQVGDLVEFGQPYGDMILPEASNLVLLAAGSGITPMLSMIETWAKQPDALAKVQLLYWVKDYEDAAFEENFKKIAETNDNFSFQIFYTQQTDQRLNTEHLSLVSQPEQSTVYACGPSGFVSLAEELFSQAVLFKGEAFSLSQADSCDTGFVNITLLQSEKTVAIPKGQSILAGLEQMNLKPKHGCRMGICNKCACNKVQGSTRNLVNGAESTEPGNLLKLCVSSAQTDLVIDL